MTLRFTIHMRDGSTIEGVTEKDFAMLVSLKRRSRVLDEEKLVNIVTVQQERPTHGTGPLTKRSTMTMCIDDIIALEQIEIFS